MKPIHLIAVGLVFFAVSTSQVHAEKPTVAVFDFDIAPAVTSEVTIINTQGTGSSSIETARTTNLLTNKLITTLTQSDEVVVVEREKIAKIMQETALSESDLTDPNKAVEVGKLLGADYMLFGSISVCDGTVEIKKLPYNAGTQKIQSFAVGTDARLVETEKGQVTAAASLLAEDQQKELNPGGNVNKLPAKFQNKVLNQLARMVTDRMMATINPIKVARLSGNTAYLNRGNLQPGTRFTIVKVGEVIRDPDDPDKILGQTETPIAHVEVTSGLQQMSKAKVTRWQNDERNIPPGSICRPPQVDN